MNDANHGKISKDSDSSSNWADYNSMSKKVERCI